LVGGVGEGGGDVLRLQEGIVFQNFLAVGSCGDEVQDVADPHPIAANAGSSATFAGLGGDAIEQVHEGRILTGLAHGNLECRGYWGQSGECYFGGKGVH
jgi:hypothetical protein